MNHQINPQPKRVEYNKWEIFSFFFFFLHENHSQESMHIYRMGNAEIDDEYRILVYMENGSFLLIPGWFFLRMCCRLLIGWRLYCLVLYCLMCNNLIFITFSLLYLLIYIFFLAGRGLASSLQQVVSITMEIGRSRS